MSDEIIEIEYSAVGDILDILDQDGYEWVDEYIKDKFQFHYAGIMLGFLERINLLMFEIREHYKDSDQYLLDVCSSALYYCNSVRSRVYLLERLNEYSKNASHVFELFDRIEKEAKSANDFRLLADSLREIYINHRTVDKSEITARAFSLLNRAESLSTCPYELFSIALSYLEFEDDGKSDELVNKAFELLREKNSYIYTYELLANLMDEYEHKKGIGSFPDQWGYRFGELLHVLE